MKNLTTGHPLKLIFFFALPLMFGNFLQQLYIMVDTMIVGRFVGVDALASIGGADWINWADVMWGDVDYMFVDMPPGTGDVPLTVFQSLPLDGIIIVTSPQELVGMIVSKAVNMAKKMDVDIIGIVENMSYVKCPDCDKKIYMFGKSHSQEVADRYQLPLLGQLPIDSELTQLSDQGYVENYHSDWFDEFSQKVKDI